MSATAPEYSKPYPSSPPQDAPPPYSPSNQGPVGFTGPPPQPHPQPHIVYAAQPPGSSVTVIQPAALAPGTTTYVIPQLGIGVCPRCRVGVMTREFTCCGILMAILFFPIGVLCCFLMMEQRCSNCRAAY